VIILRARTILPVSGPPITDGAIVVSLRRIRAVARWRNLRRHLSGKASDLGDVLLLPGLVNAHCHLDYTHMAGLIPPMRSFTNWIRSITALKSEWNDTEFADSWRDGAQMLLQSGTTTVADVEALPGLLPAAWKDTPLRVLSFFEMIGIRRHRKARSILAETMAHIRALGETETSGRVGLSPHAPYSTTPALLRLGNQTARRHNWRLVTHIAESADEFEMYTQAQGDLCDWLRRNTRDMSDCGHGSPVEHLDRIGYLSPRLIAIHVNHLAPGDAARLSRRRVHVVHCPRSHHYFDHPPFPYSTLARAGVPISLGTDSLATVRTYHRQPVSLSLFDEMGLFAALHPDVPASTIVRMVTLRPARALGFQGRIGELTPGASADLIAIPFHGKPAEAWTAAVQHTGCVAASMIAGRWALPPAPPAG
jgi:aminodeoxyfutalosine deaminase